MGLEFVFCFYNPILRKPFHVKNNIESRSISPNWCLVDDVRKKECEHILTLAFHKVLNNINKLEIIKE